MDTETGEVKRARVAPADRAGVRRFLERFRGQELEVALEATTGGGSWSRSCGGSARSCIWPSRRRRRGCEGPKKRAKNDRADARHLRELLMIERLPESWIPPDHILDLRARVRLRHTLSEQRCGVAAADPGDAVSPRLPAAPAADDRRRARVARRAAAAGRGARAGHGRAGDDRRARPRRSRRWRRSCARMRAARPGARR